MMTGRWIGRFSYDQPGVGKPVAFEATISELAGSLTGTSREPNSFRSEPLLSLDADLTGWREGGNVGWRKTYTGFDQGDSPAYSGVVDASETRIIGTWSFPSIPWFTGTFSMVRAPIAQARRSKKVAAPIAAKGR